MQRPLFNQLDPACAERKPVRVVGKEEGGKGRKEGRKEGRRDSHSTPE